MADHAIFTAGEVQLQSGLTLRGARLAYKTYGTLNSRKDNTVVVMTPFGSQHTDIEWTIGSGRAVDPSRHFVVFMNLFGNGLSSSPSEGQEPYSAERWPNVTAADNVVVQERLLREVFGIEEVSLAYGFSMGGIQAFHWAALYPDKVRRFAAICGAARISPHTFVFLEGIKAALVAAGGVVAGRFAGDTGQALRVVGRLFAGWAVSQAFYRHELWRSLGYTSIEDYIVRFWEANFLRRDPANLLAQIWTWQHADISDNPRFGGDIDTALAAIMAKGLIMPSQSDLYVHPEDSRLEAARVPRARYVPIASHWGHRAGMRPVGSDEDRAIESALRELLA